MSRCSHRTGHARCGRLDAAQFDLALTLESGQTFHWLVDGEWYVIPRMNGLVAVRQSGAELEFASSVADGSGVWTPGSTAGASGAVDAGTLRRYLGLGGGSDAVIAQLGVDEFLREAVGALPGLRVMRQPVWECLLAFLLTPANNITRIRLMMRRLRERFGRDASLDGWQARTMPAAAAIASSSEHELRELGLGWRAPLVWRTACMAADGWELEALRALPYDEAKARLQELPGVGPKVADCVLLFGCEQYAAFPVDVWVQRVIERLYFRGRHRTERQIRAFADKRFGAYAGYAQQFLYHYARLKWGARQADVKRSVSYVRVQGRPSQGSAWDTSTAMRRSTRASTTKAPGRSRVSTEPRARAILQASA